MFHNRIEVQTYADVHGSNQFGLDVSWSSSAEFPMHGRCGIGLYKATVEPRNRVPGACTYPGTVGPQLMCGENMVCWTVLF